MTEMAVRHIAYTQGSEGHDVLVDRLVGLVNLARQNDGMALPDFSVLDGGTGRGELLAALTQMGVQVRGVDMDPQCVELSLRYAPCQLASVEQLGTLFGRDEFDLVVLSHVLEHCYDPRAVIEEIKVVSKRWVLLAVPNPARPRAVVKIAFGRFYSNTGHVQAWDASHFHHFLTLHCNLEIVQWETDLVRVVPTQLLRRTLRAANILDLLEVRFLPRLFPYLSTSLIVLCRIP